MVSRILKIPQARRVQQKRKKVLLVTCDEKTMNRRRVLCPHTYLGRVDQQNHGLLGPTQVNEEATFKSN